MNDFERKLREQLFRPPPPDLREAIFGRGELVASGSESPNWTWRDWFWPAPQAWAALAALWIVFAALSMGDLPAPRVPVSSDAPSPLFTATLLSYHTTADLKHVLELAN
jgi:hypothetical protein